MHRRTTLMLAASLLVPSTLRAQDRRQGTAGVKPLPFTRSHGLSLLGNLALPPDFSSFPWVNAQAPKGGDVVLGAVGSFDSFNPFIVRGTPAGIGSVFETLLLSNVDEAASAYGHLAQFVDITADRTQVAFEIRPESHFHDGHPVTADDVVWSFQTLMEKGRPFYRAYWGDVADVTAANPHRVIFKLKTADNVELPQILGGIPVLPRHWWQGRDFSEPLTEAPLGSGPYKISGFEMGRTVTLSRVPEWWAVDKPTGRGMHNFDRIRTEYFRDATVALQAFKAGQLDYRQENIAKDWATAYNFPAKDQGLVKLEEVRHHLPTGMQGFAMNLRRPLFSNRLVRQALAWAFDFEWANKNLFYDSYTRTESYFSNSELASSGIPGAAERALLDPFRDQLPTEVFTDDFKLPVTDGSGNNRAQLRHSLDLLAKAGWKVQDRKMTDLQGKPVTFEIVLDSPTYERVALPYVQTLAKLGIEAHVRTVDPAQYQRRIDTFDYDMTMWVIGASTHPGNEQRDSWSSHAAQIEGSQNIMGVNDPVVDALVEKVVTAPDYKQLLTATHALDRVLLWNWYMVPQWHLQKVRAAYWDRFGFPDKPVRPGVVFDSWWIDPQRAAITDPKRHNG